MKTRYRLILCVILFATFSCGSSEDPRENIYNKAAISDIKTAFGEKVFEAIITEADVVYVSVADNGVDQGRFAQTVCNILKKHKATSNWVKIVKVNSQNDLNADNAYGVLLGESHCN